MRVQGNVLLFTAAAWCLERTCVVMRRRSGAVVPSWRASAKSDRAERAS